MTVGATLSVRVIYQLAESSACSILLENNATVDVGATESGLCGSILVRAIGGRPLIFEPRS